MLLTAEPAYIRKLVGSGERRALEGIPESLLHSRTKLHTDYRIALYAMLGLNKPLWHFMNIGSLIFMWSYYGLRRNVVRREPDGQEESDGRRNQAKKGRADDQGEGLEIGWSR